MKTMTTRERIQFFPPLDSCGCWLCAQRRWIEIVGKTIPCPRCNEDGDKAEQEEAE